MAGSKGPRSFGSVRQLPSKTAKNGRGKWQAFYADPHGTTRTSKTGKSTPVRHNAPHTFDSRGDAEAWLVDERRLISAGTWTPPAIRKAERANSGMPLFGAYAETWIDERKVKGRPLAARTRDHYRVLLANYLEPFAHLPLDAITPSLVTGWYDAFVPMTKKHQGKKTDGGTTKAHTYSFARAVLNTAISADGPIAGRTNPFAIRGAGVSPDPKREELATSGEVDIMLDVIRPKWRAAILVGLWTGLRAGEVLELRRRDVDLEHRVLRVRRAVSRSKEAGVHVKAPKSDAGIRRQRIPKALVEPLRQHLKDFVAKDGDALLFPGRDGAHLSPATFYGRANVYGKGAEAKGKSRERLVREGNRGWYHARQAAGHPELRFHDLRATGATLLAQSGAQVAEVQAFLGDSTPAAALRYVRAAQSRMDMLTDKLSEMATAGGW